MSALRVEGRTLASTVMEPQGCIKTVVGPSTSAFVGLFFHKKKCEKLHCMRVWL